MAHINHSSASVRLYSEASRFLLYGASKRPYSVVEERKQLAPGAREMLKWVHS